MSAKEQRKARQPRQQANRSEIKVEEKHEEAKETKGNISAKEPRKPRQPRQQANRSEIKVEKKQEEKAPSKPVYEDPGPEFYKGLKRETDEILKITEEANSKYKKKEIQSNWTKYEMPIESYDEIEEQENLGADYEKLSQAPLSAGGHFQFKHEKSWDIETAPSLYDKYFDIDMENLACALSTIPFYKRNSIDKTVFSETDVRSMDNRSIKYERKYYNDKSFITPDLAAQDSILGNIRENIRTTSQSEDSTEENNRNEFLPQEIKIDKESFEASEESNMNLDAKTTENNETSVSKIKPQILEEITIDKSVKLDKEIDDLVRINNKVTETITNDQVKLEAEVNKLATDSRESTLESKDPIIPPKDVQPIIESPEDLEKWLDDFLDG